MKKLPINPKKWKIKKRHSFYLYFNKKTIGTTTYTNRAQYTSHATGTYNQTNAIGLFGSTDDADNLPPYQVVYMWQRTT